MGCGIAQLCASRGFAVCLQDNNAAQSAVALSAIAKSLTRAAERGECDVADIQTILARIKTHDDIGDWLADADIVIEAVSEDASN